MAHRYSFLIFFLVATLPLTASRGSKPTLGRAPAQAAVLESPVMMSQVIERNPPLKSTPRAKGALPLIIESIQ